MTTEQSETAQGYRDIAEALERRLDAANSQLRWANQIIALQDEQIRLLRSMVPKEIFPCQVNQSATP